MYRLLPTTIFSCNYSLHKKFCEFIFCRITVINFTRLQNVFITIKIFPIIMVMLFSSLGAEYNKAPKIWCCHWGSYFCLPLAFAKLKLIGHEGMHDGMVAKILRILNTVGNFFMSRILWIFCCYVEWIAHAKWKLLKFSFHLFCSTIVKRTFLFKYEVIPASCHIAAPVESRPRDVNYTSGGTPLINDIRPACQDNVCPAPGH